MTVCVCLSVRELISGSTHPIFIKLFVHFNSGRCSVLFCRRCDTLCTSGFIVLTSVYVSRKYFGEAVLCPLGCCPSLSPVIS